ncbi:MAG: PorT family protein [Bacteroidales bacterium]|nr:PorT family protein [Bacteroidales bacterium]
MKKILIIILALVMFKIHGQNHYIGLDGGIYWANIASKDFISKPSFKASFAGGVTYEYFFNKNVSIGAGIAYNVRGFATKITTDTTGNTIDNELKSKTNFAYISIPLKLGYSYGKKKLFGFAKIGLVPAILLKAQIITPLVDVKGEVIENITENLTSKIRKMDIGGIVEIGGGYNITERCRVKLSLSYQHSFSSITTDNYYPNSAIRNRGVNLALGLDWAVSTKPFEEYED